jgi:hypothetical protein
MRALPRDRLQESEIASPGLVSILKHQVLAREISRSASVTIRVLELCYQRGASEHGSHQIDLQRGLAA